MKVSHPLLPFKIKTTPKELNVTAHGGLPLVLEVLRTAVPRSNYKELAKALGYKGWKVLSRHAESLILLIVAGGDCLDDLKILRGDTALQRLLGFTISSATQAKDFLYRFDQTADGKKLSKDESASLSVQGTANIRDEGPGLRILAKILRHIVRMVYRRMVHWKRAPTTATLDLDATVVAGAKSTALYCYEGFRGYQPMMAMMAELGVWLVDQFRDGNVGSNTELEAVYLQALDAIPPGIKSIRFRADSAFYNEDLLTRMADKDHVSFAVSVPSSQELVRQMGIIPDSAWNAYLPRPKTKPDAPTAKRDMAPNDDPDLESSTEIREWAELPDFIPNWKRNNKDKTVPFRYIAIRVRNRQKDLMDESRNQWRHFAIVTNNHLDSGLDVLHWHRQKQGTVEHGHGDLKNELAAGNLPTSRFGANAAWWRLNTIAHNLLVFLKLATLPEEMHAMRPKRLRFCLFDLAGIVIHHARRLVLHLSLSHPGAQILVDARQSLLLFCQQEYTCQT